MANGKLNAFKRIVSNRIVRTLASLVIAGGITFASKRLDSYETGTFSNQSIHPLLVDKLEEYAQIPDDIFFDKDEVKKGTINEDSPEKTYIRAFNHFTPGIFGFPSSIEWVLSSELQSGKIPFDNFPAGLKQYYQARVDGDYYPYGDHSWNKTVEDFENGQIGENFGFNFHVIADLTSMAHVHQDIHPIYDSYESWTNKHKGEIMDFVKPSQTPEFSNLEDLMEDLGDFTRNNFPSDDAWGDSLKGLYKTDNGNKQYLVKTVEGKEVRILRRGFFLNFRDGDCFLDQWSILGTKSVEYGAGAMVLLEGDQPNCTPKNYQDCSNGNLHWFDSCGNKGQVTEYCDNGCSGGKCKSGPSCTNNDYKDCNGNEVWWFDSCDNPQDYVKSCDYGCSNGVCEGQSCSSHANKVCDGSDVYWKDSCGNLEDWVESCDYGCNGGECNGPVCSDKCDYSGQKECVGSEWKECGYVGDCLEWGGLNSCSDYTVCKNGLCIVTKPDCSPNCALGDECNLDEDCQTGKCNNNWPNGSCVTDSTPLIGCEEEYGNAHKCKIHYNLSGVDSQTCVKGCDNNSDCREDYECKTEWSGSSASYTCVQKVCLPK